MNTSPSQTVVIFAWLLCGIMFNTGLCSFTIRCKQQDMHALLNFKQGVKDPSGLLSSWSTELDCCEWRGVNCNNITSRVTDLSLPCSTTLPSYLDREDKSHCLTGSIHLSLLLMELEFLDSLNLRNNDFFAIQFDYMHNHNCHNLSATTPHHCVNSSTLRHLDLSLNTKLVLNSLQWLPSISSLEYLNLRYIDLSKETNWLQLVTMLPSLSYLNMRSCQLEDLSLSTQYANFTALKVLRLSANEFNSELPKWLFNLSSNIYSLDLSSSSLIGHLPKALLNLRELEDLVLEDNNFDGPIPDWLGEFEHLQVLIIGVNMFSGFIPTNLGNISTLTNLDVASNPLTGVVSERNLAKLSKLKVLYIYSYSALIFDFDSHWIPPFQLEELVIGFANPNLPTWLYTQKSIESLTISGSSFEVQDKFWNYVSRMSELELEGNSIYGNISNVLLNSTFIDLSSNGLKGCLPRLSANVAIAALSNNSLTGDLSPLLCDHKMLNGKNNLVFLDISQNQLSGGLTSCWKNWKSLVAIHLGSNNLEGKIPPSMGLLPNLTSLHLHENNLHGEIPSSLQNCRSLLVFNVRNNHFSGNIPNWISHNVMALQLSNNLSGTIPPQMFRLTGLSSLNLSHNKLAGKIPNEIGNMKNLESLDFSTNQLEGEIPESLSSLSFLGSLNLSFNNLTGKIPSGTQLQGFTALSYMGNRDLCGPPLTELCFQDDKHKDTKLVDEDGHRSEFWPWFYIGIESGFVTGFLGVCCGIFLSRRLRHAYFKIVSDLRDRLYLMIVININPFRKDAEQYWHFSLFKRTN
ncbi:unnamed protein product [Sphenostylis stenocarpa]|uniref:Leucine-rich repeat-containing N-terminal plant-type domain-containing protein n=1 Tax=Sphenostylis stenocarpa TaxID=92480 RepID=A0AA86STF9_9FABA|nr:unnamed protein product [Sphenostylis stenocarpa]